MCDGKLQKGVGCIKYSESNAHIRDAHHENVMRAMGLGFAVAHEPYNAMMSMHLQGDHGLSFEEAEKIV